MSEDGIEGGSAYWLRWQVPVCALIFVLPVVTALRYMKRVKREPLKPYDLWLPCRSSLHPTWLLFFRAFAFASMAFLLYQTAATFGFFVFFFYTQWTFALVTIYFALGTYISFRGCQTFYRYPSAEDGEKDEFIHKDSKSGLRGPAESSGEMECTIAFKFKGSCYRVPAEQRAGLLENLMQIVYQTCAGAVMLTDIVFWCLLLPFMTGENFQLTLLIGLMHSVNAVFLLLDSAINRMPFPWYGIIYFVLWSATYVVFQWGLHACCVKWWPYPFLELSSPWAPLWYLGLALVHIPCYMIYLLIIKAKESIFQHAPGSW